MYIYIYIYTYIYTYTYTYTYIWGNFSIMSSSVNYISFADVLLLLYSDILTKKLLTFYAALSKDMPE